jgi:hypothetical protein
MRSLSEVPDLAEQGAAVCAALRRQVEKLGLSIGDEPVWAGLSFVETVDPFSQETTLVGTWRGGERYGTVTFFADGRIFAEYQVLLPHPAKAEYYVEAVQVWGPPEQLRGDAVLAEYAR